MIKKLNLSFVFLLTICSLHAQKEEISILKTETGNIEGTLLIPESEESSTIVLIIAGSGPTDRNGNNSRMTNNSLKMLAEGLAENGISSLRFDKRGIGKSIIPFLNEFNLRFDTYVNDVRDWINYLHQDERFKNIIVMGHSEGSLIGMIASQKEEVQKFISLAGVGSPAYKIIKKQLKNQSAELYNASIPIINKLVEGDTIQKVPPVFYSLFRPSIQPYLISWFKYDPAKEIKKLNKEVLLIQGSTDIQVFVEDAKTLAEAKPDAKLVIFEGMNHILKEAEADRAKNIATYNMPDLPLKEGLIKTIVDFIKN